VYSVDFGAKLVAAMNGIPYRPIWMTGNLDFTGGNLSNSDINQDIVNSPLWSYVGKASACFKCPADYTYVTVAGARKPRVRTLSMSQVFGNGEWLDGTLNSGQTVWRTYAKESDIVRATDTWVFIDEHADSINDSSLAVACTGNQDADAPGLSRIIDYPGSYHCGATGISFADGHSEVHKWRGKTIQPPVVLDNSGGLPLGVSSGDSWQDMHWLASRTTVRR
jgi:hypothetical protein